MIQKLLFTEVFDISLLGPEGGFPTASSFFPRILVFARGGVLQATPVLMGDRVGLSGRTQGSLEATSDSARGA